jgi:hypothetical protein
VTASDAYIVSVGATDTEIGLAWFGTDAAGVRGLHFTRLSPDLAVITTTILDGTPSSYALPAVAPLPSGWMIANSGLDSLTVYAIAADGSLAGSTKLSLSRSPWKPLLAARPGMGPILVWMPDFNTVRAAAVAVDASSIGTPFDLPLHGSPRESDVDAAFIAGAVHIVTPVSQGGHTTPVGIFRVLPDGSGASFVGGPTGRYVRLPTLVAGAANLDLVLLDNDSGELIWQRYDAAGNSTASSVLLGDLANLRTFAGAAFGDDAMLLVPREEPGARTFSLMRVRGGSATVESTFAHVAPSTGPSFARRGSDLIAAWVGTGSGCDAPRIKIARLAP